MLAGKESRYGQVGRDTHEGRFPLTTRTTKQKLALKAEPRENGFQATLNTVFVTEGFRCSTGAPGGLVVEPRNY